LIDCYRDLSSVFMQIPNSEIFIDSSPPIYSNPEMEQIVVLAICGHQSRWKSGLFLGNRHRVQLFLRITRVSFCYFSSENCLLNVAVIVINIS